MAGPPAGPERRRSSTSSRPDCNGVDQHVRYPRAMAGTSLQDVPPKARAAWQSLRDGLISLLGDEVVAIWAHGGMTSADGPAHHGDLDSHVILSGRPDPETAERIRTAQEATARQHDVELDTWYITVDDARRSDPPPHAWREGRRDTSWSLHRAHWLAGRYVLLYGSEPEAIVRPPAWDELDAELDRELEHMERHVAEGDTDPYEATYAILNGSRILRSLETRDVVISKRAAGVWALDHLPERWHPALRGALRIYVGQRSDGDAALLAAEMPAFIAFVRERLPASPDRPPDGLPRWSGY
jgi:hypothetical protein